MGGNLGFKPLFRTHDRRDIKQYRPSQAKQKYCRICGKPFNGRGHTCNSCRSFTAKEERQANK